MGTGLSSGSLLAIDGTIDLQALSSYALFLLHRELGCPHKVQRDIRLVAYHPAVMPRRNIKKIASFHFQQCARHPSQP